MLCFSAGLSSLVFFAEFLKIITDSDLLIQNCKIEVQLKLKLHQLSSLFFPLNSSQVYRWEHSFSTICKSAQDNKLRELGTLQNSPQNFSNQQRT